jgi:hypothetical protein
LLFFFKNGLDISIAKIPPPLCGSTGTVANNLISLSTRGLNMTRFIISAAFANKPIPLDTTSIFWEAYLMVFLLAAFKSPLECHPFHLLFYFIS